MIIVKLHSHIQIVRRLYIFRIKVFRCLDEEDKDKQSECYFYE